MKEREKAQNLTCIDVEELTVRIGEACMDSTRPKDMTAREAFKQMHEMCPEAADGFTRGALAAARYIAECCNAAIPGSVEVKQVTVIRKSDEAIQ